MKSRLLLMAALIAATASATTEFSQLDRRLSLLLDKTDPEIEIVDFHARAMATTLWYEKDGKRKLNVPQSMGISFISSTG